MSKKFTFKTIKPTGRFRSFQPDEHNIKYNKKECGAISDESFKVRFMVKKQNPAASDNPNCLWRWIQLKTPQFQNVKDAKKWVSERTEAILAFFEKNNTPLWLDD